MAQGVVYYQPQEGLFILHTPHQRWTIPVDKAEIARGAFAAALEETLGAVALPAEPITADFIMPHTMYGVDFITLPTIKRAQVEEAFRAELRAAHKNYSDLLFHKSEIHTGKTVTFRVLFLRRSLRKALKEGFARLGIQLERFIPQGVALLEGAVRQQASVRKAPCVVLDMGQNDSYLAAYAADTLLGGLPIPFGLRALSHSQLVSERQLCHQDAAELLVINAIQRARSTKLTTAIDLEAADDDEPMGTDLEEADEDEDASPAARTLRRGASRTLPKFMRREPPTTPEGFLLENFRLFEKRILMLIREMSLSDYLPKIQRIFVTLPREYAWIMDTMQAEDPAFQWTALEQSEQTLLVSGGLRVGGGKAAVF